MIAYTRKGFRIAETLYESDLKLCSRCDFHKISMSTPVVEVEDSPRVNHTLLIDLRLEEEVLFHAMRDGTRYEVRRATKENVKCEIDSKCLRSAILDFSAYYDAFAARKGLRKVFRKRLFLLAEQAKLVLSRAHLPDGTTLGWHVYALCENRSLLSIPLRNTGTSRTHLKKG